MNDVSRGGDLLSNPRHLLRYFQSPRRCLICMREESPTDVVGLSTVNGSAYQWAQVGFSAMTSVENGSMTAFLTTSSVIDAGPT